jgi:hypothetical protein
VEHQPRIKWDSALSNDQYYACTVSHHVTKGRQVLYGRCEGGSPKARPAASLPRSGGGDVLRLPEHMTGACHHLTLQRLSPTRCFPRIATMSTTGPSSASGGGMTMVEKHRDRIEKVGSGAIGPSIRLEIYRVKRT